MKKRKLEELGRLSIEEYTKIQKLPVTLVLDNIRSLHNVGSAFRTSDAFRIEKIYLTGITGTPPHREIHKTALGAQDSVHWEYFSDASELCALLKKQNKTLVVVEQTDHSTLLSDWTWHQEQHLAFVFGNEVEGVSDEFISHADGCIEIPQFGTKHSFNVSVSIGIVLWEAAKNSSLM